MCSIPRHTFDLKTCNAKRIFVELIYTKNCKILPYPVLKMKKDVLFFPAGVSMQFLSIMSIVIL